MLSQKTFSHFYKEQSILRSVPLVGLGMCWSDLLGTVLLRGGEIGAKESAGRLLSYSPSPTSSSFSPHLCYGISTNYMEMNPNSPYYPLPCSLIAIPCFPTSSPLYQSSLLFFPLWIHLKSLCDTPRPNPTYIVSILSNNLYKTLIVPESSANHKS